MSRPLRSLASFLEGTMLFVFVLVPAVVSTFGVVFSMTGGMGFAAVATTVNVLQRVKGYKAGEGQLTERANNAYYGVRFDASSSFNLNRDLGRLSAVAPAKFKDLAGKKFDMTKTEGDLLATMVAPALASLEDVQAATELLAEHGDEALSLLHEAADRLATTMAPVACWLEQFPKTRIRKAS